jgi:RNA polymerase subunit RPABC4/transcription elongation factor Spt4
MFFFFIGGIQPKTVIVDRQPRACPACGHVEVYLKRVDHYMSLFFIPLFPVKRGTPFLLCENCNTVIDEHSPRTDFGQPPAKNICASCGRAVEGDFTYCPYCGRKL